ncbi:MAG TPA: SprT-like domain-containing protein [Vicinamibacterales bacterium]|nr:SprT-like domain-containing protein [Vicinamibacterales bacterium]
MRTLGALVAVLGLTVAGWVYLAQPVESASTLNVTSGSSAEIRQTAILRDNLDKPADAGLASLYAEINTKHFAGALPLMPVRWEPRLAEIGALAGRNFTLEGMFGRVGNRTVILLHPNLLPDIDALERALSHEMVHARLFFLGDTTTDHGPAFRAELERLADEGAFEGIASTEDERAQLRAWLDVETIRIKSEREALEQLAPELAREREGVERGGDDAAARRDAYNLRAEATNTRTAAFNEALAEFNRQVKRYNLMISYPDGMDEPARAAPLPPQTGPR